jgi:rhodanese-related sulfurtransferase
MPIILSFNDLVDRVRSIAPLIDSETLDDRLSSTPGEFLLIDVRENDEFRAGHIPGALGVGRRILEYHIDELAPDTSTPIVLYCRGGKRSILAAASLIEMGYENVSSLTGGYRAWIDSPDRPVTTEGEPIHHGDH